VTWHTDLLYCRARDYIRLGKSPRRQQMRTGFVCFLVFVPAYLLNSQFVFNYKKKKVTITTSNFAVSAFSRSFANNRRELRCSVRKTKPQSAAFIRAYDNLLLRRPQGACCCGRRTGGRQHACVVSVHVCSLRSVIPLAGALRASVLPDKNNVSFVRGLFFFSDN